MTPAKQASSGWVQDAAANAQPNVNYRRIVEASLGSLLVLSRAPAPFAWAFAFVLGLASAAALADTQRDVTVLVVMFSCLWTRFALPFIFQAEASAVARQLRDAAPQLPAWQLRDAELRNVLETLPDDVLLLCLARLPLADLASFGLCSRATRALSVAPALWRRIVVPDQVPTISRAIAAIPRGLARCTIAVRGGVYAEGQRTRLAWLVGWTACTGIRLDKPILLEPASEGEEIVIESDAGEAIAVMPGAEASIIRGLTLRTLSFASHAVSVYADNTLIERCSLQASGRNSCGIVVTGRGVRCLISGCSISGCGGGGVLLAFGVGPVSVSDSAILGNGWSGIGAFSGASIVITRCDIKENKLYAVGVARDVSVTMRETNFQGGLHRYLAPPLHPQPSHQSR